MAPIQKARGVAYLGTMGWSYRFWMGKLYTEGTAPKEYLREYAKRMNSVEVDATFYRIPSVSTVEAWRDAVPVNFKFAVKFPQTITHVRDLAYDAEKLEAFLRNIEFFGEKLGPLLLQFPPFLRPTYKPLERLLKNLPWNKSIAAEFRNKAWFKEDIYGLLRDHGVALVLTNKTLKQDIETSDYSYIRLEGDRKAVNGEKGEVELDKRAETSEWAAKAKKHLDSGRDVYVYFSKYYSGYPPADVEEMRKPLST